MSTSPMPTDSRHRLLLYEREGCHLCEDAASLLDALVGPGRYARVDIDADDDLVIRYGFRVPVISLDGIDRAEAPVDPDLLRRVAAELAASGG